MIERAALVPKIREEVARRILDGALAPGTQLPSEVVMARTLGVSRASLREALLHLEQDGFLIRRHGQGTFVRSAQLLQHSLNVNLSATDLIRAHGMQPGTARMRLAREVATAHEAERLGLVAEAPVTVLERVRTADGKPVVFTRDVIPAHLFASAGVDPEELLHEDLSLYRFLAERLGRSVVDGRATIRSELASADLAASLGVAAGSPTLVIEQVDSDEAGDRVLLTWERYVPGSIAFLVHRRGPAFPVRRPPEPRSLGLLGADEAPGPSAHGGR